MLNRHESNHASMLPILLYTGCNGIYSKSFLNHFKKVGDFPVPHNLRDLFKTKSKEFILAIFHEHFNL